MKLRQKYNNQTIILTKPQVQRLADIFGLAAGRTARAYISYSDDQVVAELQHGIDHEDKVTLRYTAPTTADDHPEILFSRYYAFTPPGARGPGYSHGVRVHGATPTLSLDHNGRITQPPARLRSGQENLYYLQPLNDLRRMLNAYAQFHREVLDQRVVTTPPAKARPLLKLV